ncbi:Transcription initiation factor TFIID subunit 7 [Cytospora mali]|uniref:Transcription initiation factor TFIID subunit 7 n=1 Tax=Cytospora mali TaxID=578113 RepID=A0A194VDK7_CYTMA|nr:Transcription initiation factor TFIID subunit 7 [Valsa mali var. pyri (nom. inval.)]
MEGAKKTLKLKIRTPSISSNGPGSANPSSPRPLATPSKMSPPTALPASSSEMSPPSARPTAADSAVMPPPAVPPTPTEKKHTIKLSWNRSGSQPSTPISEDPPSRKPLPTNRTALPATPAPVNTPPAPLTTTKAGRTSKPTAKKRAKADVDSDDEAEMDGDTSEHAKKKLKTIKLKSGAEDPRRTGSFRIAIKDSHKQTFTREAGSGYDSEMEDAENDPIVEEQIVLRMMEGAEVNDEQSARTAELPKVIFDGYRWPHGLTPPMHDAVHRRFRKRLTKSEILNKEQEVQRLLDADKNAISTRWEWIDERRGTMQGGTPDVDMQDAEGEEDAEGELEDLFEQHMNGGGDDLLDADLEAQLAAEFREASEDDATQVADTPSQAAAALGGLAPGTLAPGAGASEKHDGDDLFGEGESAGEYDDDDDSDDDLSPEEREHRDLVRGVREDVKDMEKAIAELKLQIAAQSNHILKKRLQGRVKSLEEDRRLRLASIGEVPPEDVDQEE